MKILQILIAIVMSASLGCEYVGTVSSGPLGQRLAGESLEVGDYIPDFMIQDKDGRAVRFSDIRGDVTILAIVAAEQPGRCVVMEPLHELAMRKTSTIVNVQYVSVAQPADAKPNPNAPISICPAPKLWHGIPICDEGGKVKFLFGAKKLGVYYVIDDVNRISAIGDVNDIEALKKDIEKPTRKAEMDLSIWNQL